MMNFRFTVPDAPTVYQKLVQCVIMGGWYVSNENHVTWSCNKRRLRLVCSVTQTCPRVLITVVTFTARGRLHNRMDVIIQCLKQK